jgi:hypothetical protein
MKTILPLLLLSVACQVKPEQPKIPSSTYAKVIWEMRKVDAAYALNYGKVDSSGISIQSYQMEVLQRFGISQSDFEATALYFAHHPDSLLHLDSLILKEVQLPKEENPSIPTRILKRKK